MVDYEKQKTELSKEDMYSREMLIDYVIESRIQRDKYKLDIEQLKMYKTQLNRVNVRLVEMKKLHKGLVQMTIVK